MGLTRKKGKVVKSSRKENHQRKRGSQEKATARETIAALRPEVGDESCSGKKRKFRSSPIISFSHS